MLPVSLSGGLVMEAILRGGESGVRVGSYIRLSEETEGMQLGLQRQREANEKTAADRCWQITREYEDAGVSAYKRRVVRPGFEQLLTDLASGLIDGICVWDSDRLARQPRDLERLIDLYETRKGLVFATANKDVDLSTSDGRFYARLMVNVANKSSADSGRRIAAKHLQLAQAGVPVGGNRPFGWQVDKRTINEEEAALIRQTARGRDRRRRYPHHRPAVEPGRCTYDEKQPLAAPGHAPDVVKSQAGRIPGVPWRAVQGR